MKRQRGFTIVSAIFILVVLAALGAFIVTVSTTQQAGSTLDLQGTRAYQAARAGVEWGMQRIWNSSPADRNSAACPATADITFPSAQTLSGFTVTVTCIKISDPAGGPTIFSVTAVACSRPASGTCPEANANAGNTYYIERRIEVTL